jgi:hypothetical protein
MRWYRVKPALCVQLSKPECRLVNGIDSLLILPMSEIYTDLAAATVVDRNGKGAKGD